MTITDFLMQRIAEDEAAARAALGHLVADPDETRWHAFQVDYEGIGVYPWPDDGDETWRQRTPVTRQITRWSPARVLAECEAKRRIVEEHAAEDARMLLARGEPQWECRVCASGDRWEGYFRHDWPCDTIRILAAVYADHDQFREEWRV
jgi:hypothetical protein